MKLIHADCLDKLKEFEDNSIDSIVTDPPYGLSFMGKKWDYDVPSQEIFVECLRVIKPGGHILAFAGSRTYHRMAVRIENAGFEIRDQIMWIYGSGFPKSHNISKYIDKKLGTEKIVGKGKAGKTALGQSSGYNKTNNPHEYNITKPGSDLSEKWNGWGTALKPAHEPIVMARKPFKGTVVNNVLEWGTGGININDSRIGIDPNDKGQRYGNYSSDTSIWRNSKDKKTPNPYSQTLDMEKGRFPANVILDKEAGKVLDEQSGISKSTGGRSGNKEGIWDGRYNGEIRDENPGVGDVGGASRFFYCPKTSKKDRNEGCYELEEKVSTKQFMVGSVRKNAPILNKNTHPTVKPTDLMLYLIRLVTPKGGTTLDPFMGSGSTGKAAIRGGFNFIGIEREIEYMNIAQERIKYEQEQVKKLNAQKRLF